MPAKSVAVKSVTISAVKPILSMNSRLNLSKRLGGAICRKPSTEVGINMLASNTSRVPTVPGVGCLPAAQCSKRRPLHACFDIPMECKHDASRQVTTSEDSRTIEQCGAQKMETKCELLRTCARKFSRIKIAVQRPGSARQISVRSDEQEITLPQPRLAREKRRPRSLIALLCRHQI